MSASSQKTDLYSRLDLASMASSSLAREKGKRAVTRCFKFSVTHIARSQDISPEIQKALE